MPGSVQEQSSNIGQDSSIDMNAHPLAASSMQPRDVKHIDESHLDGVARHATSRLQQAGRAACKPGQPYSDTSSMISSILRM